jgi:vancomycin resistance protein YoaR
MRKKNKLITVVIFSSIITGFCSFGYPTYPEPAHAASEDKVGFKAAILLPADDTSRLYSAKPYKMTSGPTTSVPWKEEDNFLAKQRETDTPILLGAYRTVLKDPLPGEEYNVHLAASMLAGKVIRPGHIFSQNESIGPYTEGKGFKKGPTYMGTRLTTTIGGGVCKIASTLYNVAILSNLEIIERSSHSMPVPYVPYGQDATVAYGARDIKFKNSNDFPILIWAQGIGNTLYIAFYGRVAPPKIEWHHETLKAIKAHTIYSDNPNIPKGTEKVVLEGMDGALVKSWLTITYPDGTVKTKSLGNSYYNPMPYFIERNQ